ncbi:glycosyltransferase family 4 protein [Desulfurococcus mucosus]|uniref:glycosyltransferase family 4 protein n=1 Tax=Desulfurococcus mucosus TaxID=2275 RepID=UPI001FDF0A71|nr:glycosyltransferase family 4 protein [Desulfurococcus mucosus]
MHGRLDEALRYILVRHHMFNTYFMGPGGSEYVTLETALAFARRGFTVYIDSVTLHTPSRLKELIHHYGLKPGEVRRVGLGDPGGDPLLIVNTSGDILSGRSDVLYLHYPSFLSHEFYYPGLNGVFELAGKTYSLLNSIVFPFVMRKVKAYIANSSFTASFFRRYYGIEPHVITPPVNTDDILEAPPPARTEREAMVLSVARISPEKHVERVIYVARELSTRGVKPRFVVAGSLSKYNKDYYEGLRELAVREGVDDIVEFKVNVARNELVELYRRSMIYLHPTPREHFGISIVEAMAAGTPAVIPLDSGSWRDIAMCDKGLALPYRSIGEASSAVRMLLEDSSLWMHLSRAGATRARELDRHMFHEKLYYTLKPFIRAG